MMGRGWCVVATATGALLFGATSCAHIDSRWDGASPPLVAAPIQVERVVVLRELPAGFALKARLVMAQPDYPNPEDPNRVLGKLTIRRTHDLVLVDGAGKDHGPMIDAARAEAARRGANALYVESIDDQWAQIYALYVSSAPEREPVANTVLADVERQDPRLTPVAPPTAIDLSRPARVHIHAEHGRCYAVVVALDASASFARRDTDFAIHIDNAMLGVDPAPPTWATSEANRGPWTYEPGTPDYWSRSRRREIGCIESEAYEMGDDVTGFDAKPLGTGAALLQVFSQPISDAELAAEAARRADERRKVGQRRAADGARHARLAETVCLVCGRWLGCNRSEVVGAQAEADAYRCRMLEACFQRFATTTDSFSEQDCRAPAR